MLEVTTDKVRREKDFHNQWAQSIRIDDLLVRETFDAPTAIENRYALTQLGSLKGKRGLDLGCGAGESSVYLALQGAEVHACDVAEEFLAVAGALAGKFGVQLSLSHAEASHLPYAENFFDFVYANGVLHHTDLIPAAKEISRVLKPGGKGVFIEPLPYNPLINIYRLMAKGVRTEDEKPLSFDDIRKFSTYFSSLRHEEFWFFSQLVFFHFYFVRGWNPSKVRYWKKIIEEAGSYAALFGSLQRMDRVFLKALPFCKPLCWNSVIVVVK